MNASGHTVDGEQAQQDAGQPDLEETHFHGLQTTKVPCAVDGARSGAPVKQWRRTLHHEEQWLQPLAQDRPSADSYKRMPFVLSGDCCRGTLRTLEEAAQGQQRY